MKRWIERVVQGRWSRPAFAVVAVLGAVIALSPAAAWLVLMQVGRLLAAHPATVILLVVAVIALVDQGRRIGRRKRGAGRWPWLLSDRGIAVIVVLMACAGAGVMVVMLALAHTVDGVERAKLQLDAIKYGLGVIAAAGAAAALLLSVRRQRHTEEDTEEQRMTAIYTAAVEQLGHAEAPVRLGGMYALERLAQANPSQRQTMVNVLCAYLRMPFTPPWDMARPQASAEEGTTDDRPAQGVSHQQQELQVRLTAQRILTQHLRRPEGISTVAEVDALHHSIKQPFWPNLDLDLTGAHMADFDFERCHVRTATFESATFGGDAGFRDATFGGSAWFAGATFGWHAQFGGARFNRHAQFGGARFNGHGEFDGARFSGGAEFGGATFGGDARFIGAMFAQDAWFRRATFGRGAWFRKTTCEGFADFRGTTFGGVAWFREVAFGDGARFGGAKVAAASEHQLPPDWTTQESGDPQWLKVVWASAPPPVDARTTDAGPCEKGSPIAALPQGQSREAESAQ